MLHLGRTIVGFLFLVVSLPAQTGSAVLGGTVKDPSGAAIPAAQVRVINQASGVALSALTDQEGAFRMGALAAATYRVETEAAGFDRLVQSDVNLAVGQVLTLDLVLTLGARSETVNVEAAAPALESQTSNVSQVVGRKMVAGLPMPNRAATSLVALAPGVVMIDAGSGAENYPVFSVAGGRARNQNFTLDGGNVTNAVGLTRPQQMTSLPMDAMQEFRVVTNNYSAEHGHSTGGVIMLTTRSGTNEFHGSLFEYVRNDAFDARNFFASSRPPLRLNQFGGALGGPIRKDKTHFFTSWERTRQTYNSTLLQTVPDARRKAGDFFGGPAPIYDPTTGGAGLRLPFPGNRIPAARIDPVAGAALDFWPAPDRAGTESGANNFGASSRSYLDRDIAVAKLDHGRFSVRYYLNNSTADNRGSFGIPESDPLAGRVDARIQSVLASHTHVFSPALLNELRATYLRRKFIDRRYGAFPTYTLPGYASLGGPVARVQTPITDTQLLDSLSYYARRHALRFGVEYRRGGNSEVRDRSSSGSFAFTPLITGMPGTPGTGDAFASFLLGEVNAAGRLVTDRISSHAAYWAWYAQDDWRATDRLTLNFGLRWEAEVPRTVTGDRMNSFDPRAINPVSNTPGVVTFAGRGGVPRSAFNQDLNNFAPRFGFAYSLSGSTTVLRGGAGVFYGTMVSNTIGDAAGLGFSDSINLVVPQADLISAMRLRDGLSRSERPPLTPALGAVPVGVRPNTAVSFFERERPTPVSYQYNLEVQHQLAGDLVVETGYLANVSHRLTAGDLSLNQVPPELMGPGDAQSRRPFPQFSDVLSINPAVGNSTWHAGFIKAEKRFGRGFAVLAHYTFSRFIDDVASADEYGDPRSYMNAYDRRLDKALSGSDVPHRAVISGLYEVRRWRLGAFLTIQSGPPFTVVTAANTTNAFSAGPLRPDLLDNAALSPGERTLARWFDTAMFRQPSPFRFGNSPRSGLRGDGIRTLDLTLERQFAVTEKLHLELRGEAYNALNHANFELPGHTLGAADFGAVTGARPARTVQVGARVSF